MAGKRAPRLSLDLLRGFCAAARHLSFTRAAQELFVTQPAISREIKTLEQQLGKPLFRRVNRALELTQAGQELFGAAREGLALIDTAAARVAGSSTSLAVTTTVALASTWLVPRLPNFSKRHPGIDMRFVATNEAVNLEREHIDVAIRFVPIGTTPPSAEKLLDYQQFPVCSPALARDRKRPLRSVDDLAAHVLLDLETTVYGRPWYDWEQYFAVLKRRALRGAVWLRFSHYDQVIEAAVNGSGVAVGKRPHLNDHLRKGLLVAPLGADCTVLAGAFYIEVAPAAPPQEAALFVAWLRAEVERDRRAEQRASARATTVAAGAARKARVARRSRASRPTA